jgi:hypothetical protein
MLALYLKNTKNTKTTKIEGLPTGFEGQDHKQKMYTKLMCDSQLKSHKETPPKPSHENAPKRLRKSPKKINGIHKEITRGHKDKLQTFHSLRGKILYKEASNLPSSYPLEDLHEGLASHREGRRNGKTKEQMN